MWCEAGRIPFCTQQYDVIELEWQTGRSLRFGTGCYTHAGRGSRVWGRGAGLNPAPRHCVPAAATTKKYRSKNITKWFREDWQSSSRQGTHQSRRHVRHTHTHTCARTHAHRHRHRHRHTHTHRANSPLPPPPQPSYFHFQL